MPALMRCIAAPLATVLLVAACASNRQNPATHPLLSEHRLAATHGAWSYEGRTGPDHWGELEKEYAACSEGKRQSPIDLQGATPGSAGSLTVDYRATPVDVLNNGHTMQASFAPGNTMTLDGTAYQLLQMHHHHPSEHVESGKSSPLEMHLVHRDAQGRLAVIGVQFVEGASHPTLLPMLHEGKATINPADLLPAQRTFINYAGSLTTPPCSEGVNWIVMQQQVTASRAQLDDFARVSGKNARPPQATNGREVRIR